MLLSRAFGNKHFETHSYEYRTCHFRFDVHVEKSQLKLPRRFLGGQHAGVAAIAVALVFATIQVPLTKLNIAYL